MFKVNISRRNILFLNLIGIKTKEISKTIYKTFSANIPVKIISAIFPYRVKRKIIFFLNLFFIKTIFNFVLKLWLVSLLLQSFLH